MVESILINEKIFLENASIRKIIIFFDYLLVTISPLFTSSLKNLN